MDINHRENVVADKQLIADALLKFDRVLKKLPDDEQKELVHLIVREITVKQYDPNSDPEPKGKASSPPKSELSGIR